jgi:hypothetical protein
MSVFEKVHTIINVFPADLKKWFRKNPVTGALLGQCAFRSEFTAIEPQTVEEWVSFQLFLLLIYSS